MFAIHHSTRCYRTNALSSAKKAPCTRKSLMVKLVKRHLTDTSEYTPTKSLNNNYSFQKVSSNELSKLRIGIFDIFHAKGTDFQPHVLNESKIENFKKSLEHYRKAFCNRENTTESDNGFSRRITLLALRDPIMTLALIDSGIYTFDRMDLISCKTREQAELVADHVSEDSAKINRLLIANAIVREDVDYIQEMLTEKRISKEEFKQVTIPVKYPIINVYLPINPLEIAIGKKNLELVKILVENGHSPTEKFVHVNFECNYITTPITDAINNDSHDIVKYLSSKVEKQIDLEIDYYGWNNEGPHFNFSFTSNQLKKIDPSHIINAILSQHKNKDE